ncbi:hypothetical protein [Neobacillus niacini]|jgi:hypothetical protein|uniref:hypothetical protein n=1 Tax=Neobacillus niacini TaxID=86668 RepID=UPI001C8D5712|nr:hypothetical protein [Neobacillus niacini]MBY0144918.1 hypothetical protein [Neobacillus niacini]
MELILLFLASILSGFALMSVEPVSFLSFLGPIFDIVGALAVIIFSLVLIFKGVKSLFK